MNKNSRRTIRIGKIIEESENVRTFEFFYNLLANPGQFIMLTDFEGGEKPFSLSDCDEHHFSITVKNVGRFTSRLFTKRAGDFMSIRGAYGSSFFIHSGKVLLIGGGYGTPPLYFLSKRLYENGAKITLINGAKSREDLLFGDKFKSLGIEYLPITESGELTNKGYVTNIYQNLKNERKIDFIYAAGPEMMLKSLSRQIINTDYEFLFERYMKCAIGICGQCTLDPLGIRVCVEGPVLPRKLVEQLTEFGSYHRDAAGSRIRY